MTAPVLESFAQRLYDSLAPLAQEDSKYSYALAYYCSALGKMFQIVEDYSRDQVIFKQTGAHVSALFGSGPYGVGSYGQGALATESSGEFAPGWSQILDIDRAPAEVLPWLGQFVGVAVTIGLTVQQQRDQIKNVNSWARGTRDAMIAAAQATLSGNKSVTFIERNGDPYTLTVITKTSETPVPSVTLQALVDQKPAGVILNYQNITGQTYFDLFTTNAASYSIAFGEYATYQDLLLNNSTPTVGSSTFGDGTFGSGTFGGP